MGFDPLGRTVKLYTSTIVVFSTTFRVACAGGCIMLTEALARHTGRGPCIVFVLYTKRTTLFERCWTILSIVLWKMMLCVLGNNQVQNQWVVTFYDPYKALYCPYNGSVLSLLAKCTRWLNTNRFLWTRQWAYGLYRTRFNFHWWERGVCENNLLDFILLILRKRR